MAARLDFSEFTAGDLPAKAPLFHERLCEAYDCLKGAKTNTKVKIHAT